MVDNQVKFESILPASRCLSTFSFFSEHLMVIDSMIITNAIGVESMNDKPVGFPMHFVLR